MTCRVFLFTLLCAGTSPVLAQSPNTATIVVVVTDQSGAVVPAAQVSITSASMGVRRTAVSGPDGSVTIPALSIAGTYSIAVSKTGFTTEQVQNVSLRAG